MVEIAKKKKIITKSHGDIGYFNHTHKKKLLNFAISMTLVNYLKSESPQNGKLLECSLKPDSKIN